MYDFYYGYLKQKYEDRVGLCYTDTDSFILLILTNDFYEDISSDVNERFDTSSYSKSTNRPITTGINKKVLGMMKDELGDNEIIENVNVCAKLYSYTKQHFNGKIIECKKSKGTKKCVKKQCLKHKDFKDAVIQHFIINLYVYILYIYIFFIINYYIMKGDAALNNLKNAKEYIILLPINEQIKEIDRMIKCHSDYNHPRVQVKKKYALIRQFKDFKEFNKILFTTNT